MTRIAALARVALATLALAIPATGGAQGADRPTVAILSFANNVAAPSTREYDGLAKAMPDFLVAELAGNPALRVMERGQVQALVDRQKIAAGTPVDRETAVRIGRLLGAQHVIFGGFMADAAGNLRVDARAVNVGTGLMEHTDRVQDRADNVLALAGQLAAKLTAGMKLPAATRNTVAATLPMKYAVMYGRALDLADRGDVVGAADLLREILRELPDFAPAKAALGKLAPTG